MTLASQLFGYLILTFLGLVVPIIGILLSIFQEGISKLTSQYENEKSQSENNIKEQLQKMGEANQTDLKGIEEALRKLKIMKKNAEIRLSYLNPKKQILRLTIPLLFAFLTVILSLLVDSKKDILLFSLIAVICFGYVLYVLWISMGIIIEVRKIIDIDKKNYNMKITELLSTLVQEANKGEQIFLSKVYISFNKVSIRDDAVETQISVNNKTLIEIGVNNLEKRMVKNIEIGFVFPLDFLIEKKDYYSIYTDTKQQIVRYETEYIHGITYLIFDPLIITPLKIGTHKIRTFIKAENVLSTYRELSLKVV